MKTYAIVLLIVLGSLLPLILYLLLLVILCVKTRQRKISASQRNVAAANGDVEIGRGTNSRGVKDGDMVILAGDGGRSMAPADSNIGTEDDDCCCCGCGGGGDGDGDGGGGGGCGGCGGCGG
ncbi:chorion class high-cysteine HCB protein 13-like [Chenopodium quinoa]|uniref:chorion class high-cysteine HCB protein 13-like n=1 Tax=Chenopodium quinoa TaxID=63459 RepID=UPI000B7765BF|nr:chorion class high-cysteine HCB protein 13-like [Chenopodium quinoa]